MKVFTVLFVYLFIFTAGVNAQMQPRGGAFATVPAPGQAQPPAVVAPQPTTPQPPPGVARPTTPTQPAQPQQQEQLRIVADPATNSLIVYGTAQEFQNIKNILKELDAVPRQVLLDVLILEVTLDDREDFGVDYEIMRGGTTSIFNRTFESRGAVLGRVLSQLGDAVSGTSFFPAGISGVIGSSNTVRALINALMTDSRVKVLSSPSVLATDNRPARIQIGSEEPTATGTLVAATGAVTPSSSTTIQYKNTGRIVTIIPQVNSAGLVNLQILAEVSQRGANVTVGQDSFPSFDIRQAETTAVVQDRDTLAIGGIIAENRSRDRRGIPYLMDIPVVGRFFGTTSDTSRRTELIMLITPNVIRNRSEGTNVTDEFKSKLSTARNELERIQRDRAKSLPKPQPQELPPMPEPGVMEEAPKPNPSSVPGRGALTPSAQPISGSVAEFSEQGPARSPVGAINEMIDPRYSTPMDSRTGEHSSNFPAPPTNNEAVAPKPQGFALSLMPVRSETPIAVASKPNIAVISKPNTSVASKPNTGNTPPVKPNRIWAVQVAALAENKDAEWLAGKMRKEGYKAYVLTSQVAEKIWHRVRVGQFVNQQEAVELKKALASSYRQAYVAAN